MPLVPRSDQDVIGRGGDRLLPQRAVGLAAPAFGDRARCRTADDAVVVAGDHRDARYFTRPRRRDHLRIGGMGPVVQLHRRFVLGLAGDVVGAGTVEGGEEGGVERVGDQRDAARVVAAKLDDDLPPLGGRELVQRPAVNEHDRLAGSTQPGLVCGIMRQQVIEIGDCALDPGRRVLPRDLFVIGGYRQSMLCRGVEQQRQATVLEAALPPPAGDKAGDAGTPRRHRLAVEDQRVVAVIGAMGRVMRRILDLLIRRIDILPVHPMPADCRIAIPAVVEG